MGEPLEIKFTTHNTGIITTATFPNQYSLCMVRFSLTCLAVLGQVASIDKVRGIPGSKLPFYQNDNGLFKCLDGSKTIPFERVNDDYCDCSDGSDEPGTSACPNGTFFCQNAGHIPAYLPSSRINDGICEESCCDGSDEWMGLTNCPNTCKQKAKEYKKTEAEKEATRASGWKKKQEWTKKAQQLRMDLENEIQRTDAKIQAFKVNLEDKEASLLKLQAAGHGEARQDHGQKEAQETVSKFKSAINVLRNQVDEQTQRIDQLQVILKDLAAGYNPNFQDMAVKGAVTAFEDLQALSAPPLSSEEVQGLLETTIEFHSGSTSPRTPSGVWKWWEDTRNKLIDFGLIQRDSFDPADFVESKQIINVKASVEKIREEMLQDERSLGELQASLNENFGDKDVLRAVKGTCFSALISDYTYEVCLLDNLHQKSSSGSTLVGKYSHVDENGSLVYNHGQKCWNGPERSGRVDMECGKENELLAVREAQKCEYVFRVKSPLACKGPNGQTGRATDEL